jgi:hypothetical protein
VVLQLVSFGEAGADTRRQQPVSALQTSGDAERLPQTLHHLIEGRLLAIDGDEASGQSLVELADEALIASWPALQAWIRTHRRTEQLRRQLETDAAAWSQRAGDGRGDVGLLDKAQLGDLAAWLTTDTRRDLGVSDAAESFIAASRAEARRRWWPGRATAGTVLAILLILLILATPIVLLFVVVLTASVIHALG